MMKKLLGLVKQVKPIYATAAAAVVVCVIVFAMMPLSVMPKVEPEPTSVVSSMLVLPVPAQIAESTPLPTPEPTPPPTPAPAQMLPHMEELYEQNSDIAGWLKIDGTVIDYPVMYTPEDGEFYLLRTFEKEDDPTERGTLFIDENCAIDPRSANLLIHGHYKRDKTMFTVLHEYKREQFYKEHPTFEYTSLYEHETYEIVAVFLSKVYYVTDDVFKYYQFYDAKTREEYDYYIENIKKLALYDTGITPQFGDELITLSTCEYSQENGRLVVVGRKIENP